MNNREKLAVAATIGTAGMLTYSYLKNRKARKIAEMQALIKLEHDLDAISRAASVVHRRASDGAYNKTGLAGLQDDFRFQLIIAENDMQ